MKWWAAAFGVGIIMIVVLADAHHLGFLTRLYDFPNGDKVGHFLIFGLLSLLVNLAVLERRPAHERWRAVLRTSIVLALLIGFEEFSQRWFPARTSSWTDLAASYLGVGSFAWGAVKISEQRDQKATGDQP